MNTSDFQDVWYSAITDCFDIYAQPITWKGRKIQAVIDSLPRSDMQRSGGGGFMEEFHGSILFQKADFTAPNLPQIGDRINIGQRAIRLVEVANADDINDPTLHFSYQHASS